MRVFVKFFIKMPDRFCAASDSRGREFPQGKFLLKPCSLPVACMHIEKTPREPERMEHA
jgi:hypothetical protein